MGVLPGIVLAAAKIFPGATRVWQGLCPALTPKCPQKPGRLAHARKHTHLSDPVIVLENNIKTTTMKLTALAF